MTASVEDRLIVRMEATLRKFERQMEKGRKAAVDSAVRSEKAWKRGGDKIAANANSAASGLQRLSNISGRGRFVLQNTANQIGDIAVQMQGGTSASRALSQQLPQLLGGFGALGGSLGLLGPLLGTVAALGFPIATAFLTASDGGRELSDVVKDMNDAMGELESVAKIGMSSVEDLTESYGRNAAAVREVFLELVAVNQQQAINAIQKTILAAGNELTALEQSLRGFADARRELLRAQDSNADGFAEFLPSEIEAMEQQVQEALNRLQEDFGLTSAQAYEVVDALNALQTSTGPEEAAEAVRQISLALSNAAQEGAELDGVFANIAQTAATAFAAISKAMTQGRRAAAELANTNTGTPLFEKDISLLPPKQREKTKASRRSGDSTKLPDGMREAQRLFQDTRTEAEKYEAELHRINELHRLFPQIITEEVRDRAIAALDEGVNKLDQSAKKLEQSLSSTFTSIVTGSASAGDALAGLLSQFAQLLAQSAFTGLFGGSGGVLASLGIGAAATGMEFAPGGPTLVGERGAEIVNLPRGSQVFSAERSQKMLGGGGVVNNYHIDARGAQLGVAEEIEAALNRREAGIVRKSVAAVGQARMRGGRV